MTKVQSLYRTRDVIIKMKQNKGGNSANTWFLTSEINNILMTTATPNSELATKLKESPNKQPQRANGRTKPIEKGGLPISIGLKKKDPFRINGCDFEDERCPINNKQACSTVGSCYRAMCQCAESGNSTITNDTDISKFNYVGTTGTSAHNRHITHMEAIRRKSKTSTISQHMIEQHPEEQLVYNVKIISTHQSNLERVTSEMIWIDRQDPTYSMNRKAGDGSWSHNSLIRLTTS